MTQSGLSATPTAELLVMRTLLRYVCLMVSAVRLSSVICDVAPYSEGRTFRQYFCTA